MMTLYPTRPIEGESFKGVKQQTVPNQSMTLKDIIKRFIRKESLPVMKDGLYVDDLGDLEKLARQDITVRMERAEQLRDYIEKADARMEALKKAQAAKPVPGGEAPEPTGSGKGAASATPLAAGGPQST